MRRTDYKMEKKKILAIKMALKKQKLEERFKQAYLTLSQQYQEILSYRFELGMSVKEIAARMAIGFKATESLLYRARQAMRIAYAATSDFA